MRLKPSKVEFWAIALVDERLNGVYVDLAGVRELVLLPLGERKDIGPLHLQLATHRAAATSAERSLHCRARRSVQAEEDFLGSGHGVAGHCKIEAHIMDKVEHPEAPIVVLC